MRPITLADIQGAVAAVSLIPPDQRLQQVENWLDIAHAADKYRKRTGHWHARFGNGSLLSAVPRSAPPDVNGRLYAECLCAVAKALAQRKGANLSRN